MNRAPNVRGVALVVVGLVVAAGCGTASGSDGGAFAGGSSGTAGGSPGSSGGGFAGGGSASDGGVTVNLTGELAGSIEITSVTALFQKATDAGTVSLTPKAGQNLVLNAIFMFPGAPRLEPITEGTAGVRCGLTVADTRTNKRWVATHAISGSDDAGTCRLELTQVTVKTDSSSTTTYDVHGSISGLLEPLAPSPSTSSLTLRADF